MTFEGMLTQAFKASLLICQCFTEFRNKLREILRIKLYLLGRKCTAALYTFNYEGSFRQYVPVSKTAEALWKQRRNAYLLVPVLLLFNYGIPSFMDGDSRHFFKHYPDNKQEYKSVIEYRQKVVDEAV